MKSLSRYEAVGIFASVAVMALVLLALRFDFSNTDDPAKVFEDKTIGTVIVVDDSENKNALAEALVDSATAGGELTNLVIDDVILGEGNEAKIGDTVTAHYIGTLRDGTIFDNSYNREEPYSFTLGEGKVIEGWEKGVLGMRVGGQRILVIPPEMGYGGYKVGPIPGNSVLIFAVELIDIVE